MKLRPTALWRTRTLPAPGEPMGISSQVRTSGPPVRLKRMAWTFCMTGQRLLGEMLAEELGGAVVGLLGGGGIPGLAADAGEGMVATGINMDRDAAIPPERRLDLLLCLLRLVLVLAGDMHQQRLRDRARLVEEVFDAAAVVADIAVGVRARRHQVGELAAEAVADRAGLAGAGGLLAQVIEAGDQILDALGLVEALVQLEAALPFGLGLVGQLDARFLAPEDVRAECHVPLRGVAITEIAHDLVDAEDL